MSQTVNTIITGAASALIASLVVGLVGYVLVVKENQLMIKNLSNDLEDARASLESNRLKVDSLKMFVISAHPSRYNIPLSSSEKLQSLEPSELTEISEAVSENIQTVGSRSRS